MLIICTQKRPHGTEIELNGQRYHFKPADTKLEPGTQAFMKADHVCIVEDEAAQHRLCAQIKESFRPADADAVIPQAPKKSSQTMAADRASQGEKDKPIIIFDGEGNEINLSEKSLEELRELAKGEFGISCHHKWNEQTIIAKIVEKTRGED